MAPLILGAVGVVLGLLALLFGPGVYTRWTQRKQVNAAKKAKILELIEDISRDLDELKDGIGKEDTG